MKRVALVVALMIVAAACASSPSTGTADGNADVSPTTVPDATAGTGAQGSAPAPDEFVDLSQPPEGPLAPDFTMALASGESFTLSAEQKALYMIFWAEW